MEDFSNKVSGPKQWFFVPIRTYREETNENYEIQGEVFLSSENEIKNIWGNKNQDKKPVWSMEGRETKATKNVKLWETWDHAKKEGRILTVWIFQFFSILSK